MQIINEAYQVMKDMMGYECRRNARSFQRMEQRRSRLVPIEITRDILAVKDESGQPLVDKFWIQPEQKAPENGPRFCARFWCAFDADWRIGILTLSVGSEGYSCKSFESNHATCV